MTMKTQRELTGWAQHQQQQTCGCVSFFFVSFFSMPTQRGRLKWGDYSSHERQHNSRVTFEPYGDKKGTKEKKRKWVQSSAEVVEPQWGEIFLLQGKTVAATICHFTAGDLTQPAAQKRSVIHKNPPFQRSFLPRATTNTNCFFFFTTINLLPSCLSKKNKSKSVKLLKLIRATAALQSVTKGLNTSGVWGFFLLIFY